MVTEPALEQVAHARTTVRVTIEDPDGGPPIGKAVAAGDFETNERGVFMGSLFAPWHRVIRYDWELQQDFGSNVGEAPSKAQIRVRVDDGTPGGSTIVVPADRFEGGPWTLSLLIARRVEPDHGVLVVDKVYVPWSRVVEYERVPVRLEPPARPDVADREDAGTDS